MTLWPVLTLALFTAFCVLASPPTAAGGWTKKNGDFSLDVTYRQVEEGKPGTAVFMLSLVCIDGLCKLETLTLNQCFERIGQRPKSQVAFNTASPWYGPPALTVTRSGNVILATDRIQGGALSYRFVISTSEPAADQLGDLLGVRGIEFSGSLDKHSQILGRQISVPLMRVPSGLIAAACQFNIE